MIFSLYHLHMNYYELFLFAKQRDARLKAYKSEKCLWGYLQRAVVGTHTFLLSDRAQRVPFVSPETCLLAPLLLPEHLWWSCTTEGINFQSKSYQTCNWIAVLR